MGTLIVSLILIVIIASIIFSIWFIGGLLLMSLGVCGIYIGKIFSQVKNRPVFIISEEINRTEPK